MVRIILILIVIAGSVSQLLAQQLATSRPALPSPGPLPLSKHGPSFPSSTRGRAFPNTSNGGIPVPLGGTLVTEPSTSPLQNSAGTKPKTFHRLVGSTERVLPIGAGGWLVGLSIECDRTCGNNNETSTMIARPDTYGLWWYNSVIPNCGNANRTGCFQQIVDSASMPSADQYINPEQIKAAYEARIAPSNTNHFYMTWSPGYPDLSVYLYSSANRGTNWSRSSNSVFGVHSIDGKYRMFGPFLAVDPANENVVYEGTPSEGVYVTTDGGNTFGPALSTPGNANGAWNEIAFDTSGGTSGTCPGSSCRTNDIVICTNGIGVFKSTDAGSSWKELNSAEMPESCNHLIVDQNGIIWVVGTTSTTTSDAAGGLYKYSGGAWSNPLPKSDSLSAVAVDPYNGNVVYAAYGGGTIYASFDRGATFAKLASPGRAAADIPWLANANETYMSTGNIVIDPAQTRWTMSSSTNRMSSSGNETFTTVASLGLAANAVVDVYAAPNCSSPVSSGNLMQGTVVSDTGTNLVLAIVASQGGAGSYSSWCVGTDVMFQSEGIGVWYITPPISNSQTFTYTSESARIEQLVTNWVATPWWEGTEPTACKVASFPWRLACPFWRMMIAHFLIR